MIENHACWISLPILVYFSSVKIRGGDLSIQCETRYLFYLLWYNPSINGYCKIIIYKQTMLCSVWISCWKTVVGLWRVRTASSRTNGKCLARMTYFSANTRRSFLVCIEYPSCLYRVSLSTRWDRTTSLWRYTLLFLCATNRRLLTTTSWIRGIWVCNQKHSYHGSHYDIYPNYTTHTDSCKTDA